MKQVRTHYSKEFKIKAVELVNSGKSIPKTADELGISHETLRIWRRAYNEGKLKLIAGEVEKVKSKEEMELARLRKELYEVTMERDILKKAVGIFSKSDK